MPVCGGTAVYNVRRPKGPPRWRCKACVKEFTVTSGTLFAWHKLPVQVYLSAIAIAINEVKARTPWPCRETLARPTRPLS